MSVKLFSKCQIQVFKWFKISNRRKSYDTSHRQLLGLATTANCIV